MIPCNAAQAVCIGISEAMNNCIATGANTRQGFIQALLDPTNEGKSSGVIQSAGDTGGISHKKAVKIEYKQRALESSIRTTPSCDPCDPKEWLCADVPDLVYYEHCVSLLESDLRLLSDSHAALTPFPTGGAATDIYRAQNQGSLKVFQDLAVEVMKDLDPLRRRINKDMLLAASLLNGVWYDKAATKTLTMVYNGASGPAINTQGLLDLSNVFDYSDCPDNVIMVGNGALNDFNTLAKFGCCNSNGIDTGAMSNAAPYKFYNDVSVGSVLPSVNDFIAWQPGSLQFMSKYNENVGPYAVAGAADGVGSVIKGTFPDTMWPGFFWDYKLTYDACTGKWNFLVSKYLNVWGAPLDIYGVGDDFEGVNGIFAGVAQAA